ncbi:MAG: SDR family NAD(P)-dependent oxidoreductase [Rhodobacteraceae bacterium]|nr:SDR family NAD(P)-dependent oxidoreductase [Paracoccaceae bacterium]
MERALVVGASGGIGRAVAEALAGTGAEVVRLSRSENGLDVTDEASVSAALAALDGPFDLILVATGALEIAGAGPEKSLRAVTPEALVGQFRLNAIGPILVLKHALRLLPRNRRAVFAALSARVGSIGDNRLGGWYSYRASKAALNQLLRTAAIEIARTHPEAVIAALHPGTVRTRFTERYLGRHPAVAPEVAAGHILAVIDRLSAAGSGGFYDWAGREVPW